VLSLEIPAVEVGAARFPITRRAEQEPPRAARYRPLRIDHHQGQARRPAQGAGLGAKAGRNGVSPPLSTRPLTTTSSEGS